MYTFWYQHKKQKPLAIRLPFRSVPRLRQQEQMLRAGLAAIYARGGRSIHVPEDVTRLEQAADRGLVALKSCLADLLERAHQAKLLREWRRP